MIEIDELDYKRLIHRSNELTDLREKVSKYTKLMLSSDAILQGEYFVIHSDLVFDLFKELRGENDDHSSDNN